MTPYLPLSIRVPQILVRCHVITHQLLQFLCFREATLYCSRPDQFTVNAYFENTAATGNLRHFAQFGVKGGEQFRAIQPARSNQRHWVQ